ncbi:hypothetical protein ACI77I_23975 [Pseudomonas sp. D47]|uniref:hypothetical protein n=1 Tax=Pseudomonas sp. D47 TaxID=3159447 RepID=UPI00387A8F08
MNHSVLLAMASVLTGEQLKVVLVLLTSLDYENFILVAQPDVADVLKMQQPNVSRAIKSLIGFGVILEGPKVGRIKSYCLNPQFDWKDAVMNHKKPINTDDGGSIDKP